MKKYLFLFLALAVFISCEKDDDKNDPTTVTDIDGNVYQTVKIGNQLWMAENLRVTHYRDGSVIPNITEPAAWTGLSSGARCYYNNDSATHDAVYGVLYNGYAITDSRNIAPEGWHVATADDWEALIDTLGGYDMAGGKMKEAGTIHWNDPNTGANNTSGFSALPGGYRSGGSGTSVFINEKAYWWSSSVSASNTARMYSYPLSYDTSEAESVTDGFKWGFSVRCVKD